MAGDSIVQLVVVFLAGVGLLLAGGINLFLRQRSTWLRAAVTLLIVAGISVAVWKGTALASAAVKTGSILLVALSICLLFDSNRLARILTTVRKPAARWSLVAVLGIGMAVGAVVYEEYRAEREIDRQSAELELLTLPPATRPGPERASTDLGHPVPVNEAISLRDDAALHTLEETVQQNPAIRDSIIRCSPATDRSNCHGWIFTGGRYWVTGAEVDRILTDNHYLPVSDPKPGDLVVYRNGKTVAHTGLVTYVTEGHPVLIEGKWGCTGVYLHAVDKSIYGSNYTYYRSARNGHLLAGLGSQPHVEADQSHSIPVIPDPARPDEFTE